MTATLRCMVAITAGAAFGVGVAFLILNLGTFAAGIWVAAAAALVLVAECVNAVRRDREHR